MEKPAVTTPRDPSQVSAASGCRARLPKDSLRSLRLRRPSKARKGLLALRDKGMTRERGSRRGAMEPHLRFGYTPR